jgi:hypothetical protein
MLSHSLVTYIFLATQNSEKKYSVTNSPLLYYKFRQISTENSLGRGGSVATFMSTGYTFMRSLEKSRQLSGNLPRDARHSGDIRELTPKKREKKKSTVAWMSKQGL